jgi:monovalent cation/hydrogen antiporter
VTILEGESLINDGTALVLYSVAVSAVVTGTFSLPDAALEFVLYGVGGTAIGLVVGWAISRVRRWISDPLVEITITLVTPYAAYIPAEELGVSGVLATVAAGLYLGWRNPQTTTPRNRLQSFGLWDVLTFLLNSVLFILIGLRLPNILERSAPPAQERRTHQRRGETARRAGSRPRRRAAGDLAAARRSVPGPLEGRGANRWRRTASTNLC